MKLDSKLEALIECKKHWEFLAETGYGLEDKGRYLPSTKWLNRCALCEYINPYEAIDECAECPLNGIAWPDYIGIPCENKKSIYKKWAEELSPNQRTLLALQIVEACDVAIKQLLKEEEE